MPEFQLGDKKRQRVSSERMKLACCWDRRRSIAALRAVLGSEPVSVSPAARWVPGEVVRKVADLLEDIDQ